ncbi:MAG: hypothetical protein HFI55_06150 [Lachnospiraceae bacterium]|nr:hypothetical protein [Lachnospiraceae bacterium]
MCTAAIIVPVYKEKLTDQELVSYKQLLHILGAFEIIIAAPEDLDLPEEMRKGKVRTEYFSREFFKSVDAYSRLMLSPLFYKRFIKYSYILIYQLDAFVFKNELLYFCGLGYDYIGAPWISGFCEYGILKRKVLYVGNGGFSLRRVEACIEALESKGHLLEQYCERNEDIFFSACAGGKFAVAPLETALAFSFEREVRTCFAANHKQLPFGCHAWERYDFQFWKSYMEDFGYELDEMAWTGGGEDRNNEDEYRWLRKNAALMEKDALYYGISEKIDSLFGGGKGKCLYLWGAGYMGSYGKDLLWDSGVSLTGFIDMNPDKQGQAIGGLKVYAPECIKKGGRIIVTVERKHHGKIRESLEELNLAYLRDYIFFEDILPEV